MKKILIFVLAAVIFPAFVTTVHAQQKIFHHVINQNTTYGRITYIARDRQGYIWFGCNTQFGGIGGLRRYNGQGQSTVYLHDPKDSNSVGADWVEVLCIDSSGMIWVGTYGAGLDRFNSATNTFTHFRHNPKDPSSIVNDTVNALLIDHLGNLWVGTNQGLDMLNLTTGKFTHYTCDPGNSSTISDNMVRNLYEDHEGNLWVGCGNPFPGNGDAPKAGGLNLFHRATGAFTRYLHDPHDQESISNNKITAIYEDSHKNLWVGTADNGLQTLNTKTGVFTHYPYDPNHPENLSAPPLIKNTPSFLNIISFIQEDAAGNLWIGSGGQGIQEYNPRTKKVTHYGYLFQRPGKLIAADTASGYLTTWAWRAFNAKDGLLWICGNANLYYVNPFQEKVPYQKLNLGYVNDFYKDPQGNLWIATDGGLLYKPLKGKEKLYVHNPHNTNSLAANGIGTMVTDKQGNLWLGTYKGSENTPARGFDEFNPNTGRFTHYTDSGRLKGYNVQRLCLDADKYMWIAADGLGLLRMDMRTKVFKLYEHNPKDKNSLSNNYTNVLASAGDFLWVGTSSGLDRLNKRTDQWEHFLPQSFINFLFRDHSGIIWAGTQNGLYRFDSVRNRFDVFKDSYTRMALGYIENIVEDKAGNLWVTCRDGLYRINTQRTGFQIYGETYGIHSNLSGSVYNLLTKDGELFIGDQTGYYSFYLDSLNTQFTPPNLNITGFQIGPTEVIPGPNSLLKQPLFLTKEIRLGHKQNSFSFTFEALHYDDPGAEHYRYMMEGYDNRWHNAGEQHKAYFFSLPVGHYVFKVMAINSNNAWSEKDIAVIIEPPWWARWWAIVIAVIILACIVWGIVYIRSRQLRRANKILEDKVNHRTKQLQESLDNLKSAQKQLIQSEKMASLGELTAGIAHEIQNPLNFVNNFSEVNTELLTEMKNDIDAGKTEDAKALANDVIENEQKINHHGKRADAIVKAMLQHSRISSGQRELTNINSLADEYLRLSYHGMRAKDKTFNAEMKTDFDETIGRINVVPQDIGRVLLNLFNNAFYAVNKKMNGKTSNPKPDTPNLTPYAPTVWLSTKKEDGNIIITVKDNGGGIPEKVKDKIFQPFFTTKPTGEGTGLGLSLSYDIIKAHDGEIKVNTKEGEGLPAGETGTEFVVKLPIGN